LNHDGNILDCANVALICAMAHFRLPEVSVIGDEIKIVNIFFCNSIPNDSQMSKAYFFFDNKLFCMCIKKVWHCFP
jgi:exosome complex RNA-binding protein Rrp42 (RNase PH superfamily)